MLKWTKEKPKEPGWYWTRTKNLMTGEYEPAVIILIGPFGYGHNREQEWAGPIPEPMEDAE